MSRLRDLHHRAPSHRDRRRPLVLTHPLGSIQVCLPLLAIAVVLTGSSWVLEAWLLAGPAPTWDLAGLGWAADQRGPPTIALARLATHLCDLPVVAALAAALVVLARARTGRWDAARLVMAVLGGALLITAVSKELTDRARPDGALTSTLSSAFPSGHASRAAVVYLLLAWLAIRWARHRVTRRLVACAAVGMALLTGWSRVLLGVHWPTDVLAGSTVGVVWLVAVIALTRPRPAPATTRT